MLPSIEIKNYKITFADSEKREPLHVGESKANTIRSFLRDKGASYIDLTDDFGNYSETIQKRSIKGVELVKRESIDSGMVWVCDCGQRNRMHIWPADKCSCKGLSNFYALKKLLTSK